MKIATRGRTISEVKHHNEEVNGTTLHYVSAGEGRAPVLLIHGFPETWWAFHKVIPLLASSYQVFAVDLRGFGDSSNNEGLYDSATAAEDLHQLIEKLDVGPVHLVAQDIAGATVFRLASLHPEDVLSFTAVEMGLPGFGVEGFADVTHGGAWYIGFLAAPGIPELLLGGHEREFLTRIAYPAMCAVPDAVSESDLDEFFRTYSRPNGWRGAVGLYQSMLKEGSEIQALAESRPLTMPVLAVGAGSGGFTAATMTNAGAADLRTVSFEGVGHYAAMEAPDELAAAISAFVGNLVRR
jgi:pimeloyl-ACP methyl ester carboxylesterase